ncbi:MAG: hypothetical protein Q4E74_10815, partial [Ruminococcus sp.]|nr:hypothetical protein [Ruminococcus sp.]
MEKEIMKGRKRKIIILLTAIIILIATVVCIVIYNNTAWKRNFEIKYLGFDAEHEIYLYSITNLTQKTYKDVKAIISVD